MYLSPVARRYERPPVSEALCEFQFESPSGWDWTVAGLLYARIGEHFPIKRERGVVELQVRVPGMDRPEDVRQGIAKLQFLAEDERTLVQVGPNVLTVNRLAPYPGWEAFRTVVLEQYRQYVAVAA